MGIEPDADSAVSPQISDSSTAGGGSLPPVAALVLAAGRSSRMRSKLPKTLHPVCGLPLILHILNALEQAGVTRRVVVVGHQADAVRKTLDTHFGPDVIEYVEQTEQRGTGHAAQMAEPLLAAHPGPVLVVPGDTPLLTGEILTRLIQLHCERAASATLLTAILPHDAGTYGRIVRDDRGNVLGIVEARDATPKQLALREINTSIYVFNAPTLFPALRQVRPDNAQAELYLTDAIGILRMGEEKVVAFVSSDPDVVLGVNTRVELVEVATRMQARILQQHMLAGVTVIDPQATYVDAGVVIGQDTILYPGTYLHGQTVVGEDCILGPGTVVRDCRIGNGVQARYTVMEQAEIADSCRLGPFAHLRPGTKLGRSVKIGNFVETKAATLWDNVSAGHLSYLGDAEVGAGTNIGAGTITCNYDGYVKHRTQIGENAFVGTHTTLVAPVQVGDRAFTAAGSVIVEAVPNDALAIARERQTNKEGWANRRRAAKGVERGVDAPPTVPGNERAQSDSPVTGTAPVMPVELPAGSEKGP